MNVASIHAAGLVVLVAASLGCGGGGDGPGSGGGDAGGSHAGGGGSGAGTTGTAGGDSGGGGTGPGGSGGSNGDGSGWVDKGSGVPDSPVQKGAPAKCSKTIDDTGTPGQIVVDPGVAKAGDVVCIKAGTYNSLTASDLVGFDATPITIQNGGPVVFKDVVTLKHLSHVVFSGALATPGMSSPNGISMQTSQDAIDVQGKTDHLTIQNIDFVDVGRIGIQFLDKSVHYDASETPLYTDVVMKNLSFSSTGFQVISFSPFLFIGATDPTTLTDGTPETNGQLALSNLASGVEIANCDIQGGKPEEALYLGNVFDVDVHHVRFQHVNIEQIGHIEMIFLVGDGKIHHNYVDDYRGMVARVFPMAWNQKGTLDIYDNIALDGQWYSDYEINPQQADKMASARWSEVDTRIYGNTTGNLASVQIDDDPKCQDYQAVLVDDYLNPEWYQGKLDVRDNVVFQTRCPSYHLIDGAPPGTEGVISPWQGNVCSFGNDAYYDTFQAAGFVDAVSGIPTASSPLVKAGAPLDLIAHDFFGRARDPKKPTIGAVEAR